MKYCFPVHISFIHHGGAHVGMAGSLWPSRAELLVTLVNVTTWGNQNVSKSKNKTKHNTTQHGSNLLTNSSLQGGGGGGVGFLRFFLALIGTNLDLI
jgi:hypothetical protein